jgi:hypothetical protein
MPIHVGEISSDVSVFDSDLPLSEAQIEKLVAIILQRLEKKQREQELSREATVIRRSSAPPLPIGS